MGRQAVTAALVAVAVVVVALLVYYLYPTTVPTGVDAPGVTDLDRGDDAREFIARQDAGNVDYEQVFGRAEDFQSEGRLADAQLLFFYAARGGHARSAFELASAYDPSHHDPAANLLPEPDPFQAYKWYTQALEGGVGEARTRLEALRDWAEREAQTGNPEAEQLLLQWN